MTTSLYGENEPLPPNPLVPDLVINYRHQIDTGVTVHQPVVGLPVIVRRPLTPRFPGGRLEMYCKVEQLALDLEQLCNGTQLVHLESDDVPGAPFTFSPTGMIETVWNQPYESWTVTVPYVRSTW